MVLSVEEVRAVLAKMRGQNLLITTLLYGGGLRLLECLQLRMKDIDWRTARRVAFSWTDEAESECQTVQRKSELHPARREDRLRLERARARPARPQSVLRSTCAGGARSGDLRHTAARHPRRCRSLEPS